MTARVAPRGHDPRPPVLSRSVPSRQRPRAGFTLIELMIVIVIIILLIALLVPAIGGALRNAREGQVKQEIGQLEYAIADFKAHYGMNPPSYIDLRIDSTSGQLPPRTVALLRRLWPNINLTVPSDVITTGMQRVLEGDQCLVFFLGGIYDPTTEAFVGFSVNPRSPFLTTGKRVGPFFEFQKSRLVADTATGGIIGYLDPLPDQKVPYYYVTNDRYAQYVATPPPVPSPLPLGTILPPKMVYFQDAANKSAYNAQSFQIISAGPDGATLFDPDGAGPLKPSEKPVATPDHASYKAGYWGVGGHFDPKKTNLATALSVDADNITNFHGGRLYP